jgi:hypothetical protein
MGRAIVQGVPQLVFARIDCRSQVAVKNRLWGEPMHTALQINILLWIGIAFAVLEIERLVALLS